MRDVDEHAESVHFLDGELAAGADAVVERGGGDEAAGVGGGDEGGVGEGVVAVVG